MLDYDQIFDLLGTTVVVVPFVLVLLVGIPTLIGRPLAEKTIGRLVRLMTVIGLLASVAVLVMMLFTGHRHVPIVFGSWVNIPHYHFSFKFMFDRLSVPFVILTYVLSGVISAFANSYMHREPGSNRFYVLYALFVFGMVISALAGTIETLFTGWELVGLSSALLVAFYQSRQGPVRNGLQVWSVYRVSDAAFLIAAVFMHHMTGEGDFEALLGFGPWPLGHALLTQHQALLLGILLLISAAGKSALVPFSGWLPRAMEGPTPSSAVFYGALSVHLGAYLLLRVSPILDLSPWLSALVVAVGLITAIFAGFTARVQTDIKSALSFASLTQVGLIVAEIGLGLRYVALVHILGHACLRTLQFVRAPSLLHDYRVMENAIGDRLPRFEESWQRLVPKASHGWFYRLAMERGYMDTLLRDYIVRPVLGFFRGCDKLERKFNVLLAGRAVDPVNSNIASTERLEELL